LALRSRVRTIPSPLWSGLLFLLQASSAAAQEETAESIQFCREHWLAVRSCRDRPWTGPELELGVAVGVSAMNESGPFSFHNGVGAVTNAGPAWGVLAGLVILPWLSLEARYLGSYDSADAAVSRSGGFLGSAGTAVVRLTAPFRYVHPYLFGGVGYYDFAFVGSSGSVLHSSSQAGIPMGIGVDVPLNYHLSLGVEASYDFQVGEDFSDVTTNGIDGGDVTRFDLVFRTRL
jgi:hypothetical protein